MSAQNKTFWLHFNVHFSTDQDLNLSGVEASKLNILLLLLSVSFIKEGKQLLFY